MSAVVVLPSMSEGQREGWHALLDLRDVMPTGWTLVGGQMVHLWCAERGVAPARPTDDLDAVLDVRARPAALMEFTRALADMGFAPEGETWNGHQHRWVRDGAQIDVLIPRWLGERAANSRGAGGGTTLETPGAQQALDRTEEITVEIEGRLGIVRRPNLLGALVAKGAAHTVVLDKARRRHLTDFLVLTTMIEPGDGLERATGRDRSYLESMLGALLVDGRAMASVEGAPVGVATLRLALGLED